MAATSALAAEVELIETGTLRVGSDLTYPPYNYLEAGEAAGFDPELLRAMATRMGTQAKFLDTRFANLIVGVNARRYDVVASTLYVTAERAEQVDYVPYMKTGGSLVVDRSAAFQPRTAEDLCGKRVASIKGASWIPKLESVSTEVCLPAGRTAIDVREYPTSPQATQALLVGAVDAQFEDAAIAKMAVDQTEGRLAISSDAVLFPAVVGLAVRKGNPTVLVALEQALQALKDDGRYAALLARYNVVEPTAADIQAALAPVVK
ncbi:transporter substrate-binding domain-containing protein [Alcaligenaceae bacterium SJ-26]|nr:transporter substrate-binding domain-containing protein [Alcaligenaceae bacterium SJ-26]